MKLKKGHMQQQCQNVRSTKVKQNATDNQGKENHQDKPQVKLKEVYVTTYMCTTSLCVWGPPICKLLCLTLPVHIRGVRSVCDVLAIFP